MLIRARSDNLCYDSSSVRRGDDEGYIPPVGFFFFSFKRLKTYIRNMTGQSRLNGLTLMNIHQDIPLYTKQIDEFSVKARWMNFRLD
jgi:hypothetical protein